MKRISIFMLLAAFTIALSCVPEPKKYDSWPDWSEDLPEVLAINGQEADCVAYEEQEQPAWTLSLTKGQRVEFAGFEALSFKLQSDWFTDITKTDRTHWSAEFTGESGDYSIVYHPTRSLLYVEQPGRNYPDALWLIGTQWGHPGSGEPTVTKGWYIGGANDVGYLKNIGQNKWQYTLYLAGGFKFKLFKHRAWGNEITSPKSSGSDRENELKCLSALVIAGDATNGDFVAGPLFEAGVYTIVVDLEAKTLDVDGAAVEVPFKVNGTTMGVLPEASSMFGARLHLSDGDVLTFTSMGDVRNMVQPEWLSATSAKTATFHGPAGEWSIFYDSAAGLIYMENRALAYPASIWIQGSNFGHPAACKVTAGGWKWDSPADALQCRAIADGVYETTAYLRGNSQIKFYKQRGWGEEIQSLDHFPMPSDKLEKGWNGHLTGDFVPAGDFQEGVYRIRVDLNKKIVGLMDFISEADFKVPAMKVNGSSMTSVKLGGIDYMSVALHLAPGQEMSFEGFSTLQYLLQPEFYSLSEGKVTFIAPENDYVIYYMPSFGLMFTETHMDAENPEVLWLAGGQFYGHPWTDNSFDNRYIVPEGVWKHSESPFYRICAVRTAENRYEATVFLAENAYFRFYHRVKASANGNVWTSFYAANDLSKEPARGNNGEASIGLWYQNKRFGTPNANMSIPTGEKKGVFKIVLDTENLTATYTKVR